MTTLVCSHAAILFHGENGNLSKYKASRRCQGSIRHNQESFQESFPAVSLFTQTQKKLNAHTKSTECPQILYPPVHFAKDKNNATIGISSYKRH